MEPIKQIRSKTVVMPNDDIDTDQIIPARFLTTTTKEGLGKNLFNDWRYDARRQGARRLRAQSAREPRRARSSSAATTSAAARRASTRRGPCSTSAFAPSSAPRSPTSSGATRSRTASCRSSSTRTTHRWLLANPGRGRHGRRRERDARAADGARVPFPIDEFSRYCLLNGVDQLGFLLRPGSGDQRYEQAHA